MRRLRLVAARTWSIGLVHGDDLTRLRPVKAPILSRDHVFSFEVGRGFADPFFVLRGNTCYLFAELMDARGFGRIAVATSADGIRWEYRGVVLPDNEHLSYPYVFEHDGAWYMTPSCLAANGVQLFRAIDFPLRWERISMLLDGPLVDPSPFRFAGHWWMFASVGVDELRLFGSDRLESGWHEHPASPTRVGDKRASRPAGRVIVDGPRIIRFAQDCTVDYGSAVEAFEITALTTDGYAERPLGRILGPGRTRWGRGGMHHVDALRQPDGSWCGVTDGWVRTRTLVLR